MDISKHMSWFWVIPQNHPTYSLPQLRSWQLDLAKHPRGPLILLFHTLNPVCQEILWIRPSICTQIRPLLIMATAFSDLSHILLIPEYCKSLPLGVPASSLAPPASCPLSRQNNS